MAGAADGVACWLTMPFKLRTHQVTGASSLFPTPTLILTPPTPTQALTPPTPTHLNVSSLPCLTSNAFHSLQNSRSARGSASVEACTKMARARSTSPRRRSRPA